MEAFLASRALRVFRLRDDALEHFEKELGRPYEGLAVAARAAKERGLITAKEAKTAERVDICYNALRHLTEQKMIQHFKAFGVLGTQEAKVEVGGNTRQEFDTDPHATPVVSFGDVAPTLQDEKLQGKFERGGQESNELEGKRKEENVLVNDILEDGGKEYIVKAVHEESEDLVNPTTKKMYDKVEVRTEKAEHDNHYWDKPLLADDLQVDDKEKALEGFGNPNLMNKTGCEVNEAKLEAQQSIVDDAFGTAHRAHTNAEGVTKANKIGPKVTQTDGVGGDEVNIDGEFEKEAFESPESSDDGNNEEAYTKEMGSGINGVNLEATRYVVGFVGEGIMTFIREMMEQGLDPWDSVHDVMRTKGLGEEECDVCINILKEGWKAI